MSSMLVEAAKKANVTILRALFGARRPRAQTINPELCERALDKLDLAPYQNTHIIEMNPGLGVWSTALHNRLNPKQHILLEPDEIYESHLNDWTSKHKNSYYLKLDGYDWTTYTKIFSPQNPGPPFPPEWPGFNPRTISVEEGINADILFTGNAPRGVDGERLLAQFMSCCALSRWVQKYGRVRFLMWVSDHTRERYLPRTGASRTRAAVVGDAMCKITELIGMANPRTGSGYYLNKAKGALKLAAERKRGRPRTVDPPSDLPRRKPGRPRKTPTAEELSATAGIAAPPELSELILEQDRPRGRPKGVAVYEIERERELGLRPPKRIVRPVLTTAEKAALRAAKLTYEEKVALRKLNDPQGARWLYGMQHPPWFYEGIQGAKLLVSQGLPKRPGQTSRVFTLENYQEILTEFEKNTLKEEPVYEAKSSGMSEEEIKRKYDEFEEQWGRKPMTALALAQAEDDEYISQAKILQWDKREFDPLVHDEATDVFPAGERITLLDFVPRVPDPYFRPSDPLAREPRWEAFDWILRNLYALRAHGVAHALKTIAPGGDGVLEELSEDEKIDPRQRVRRLDVKDFVALTKAWQLWPFKPHGVMFDTWVQKDRKGETIPKIMSMRFED